MNPGIAYGNSNNAVIGVCTCPRIDNFGASEYSYT